MSLAPAIGQADFSAGMCRNAPHLIPANGAYLLQNALLNEDGSPYRRGGTAKKSNADFGGGDGLRFLWDGWLAGGQRTVSGTDTGYAVLGADDVTPVTFGTSGPAAPVRPAVIDGILFIGTQAYGGSRKSATTSTGTVTFTNGSTTVVGVGTTWTTTVDAGMVVVQANRVHAVKSVTDNTHLELFRPFTGTTAGGATVTWARIVNVPATYHPGGFWAVVANRLVSMSGEDVWFSAAGDSTSWNITDNHKIAGAAIIGGESLGDELFVFTSVGLWGLGNMAYDETDDLGNAQHSERQLNADLLLWGDSGIATWQNSLVIPAQDGVWLMSPTGAPDKLSRSIDPLYVDYVNRGYQPGGADVFQNHYFLPIVDAVANVIDVLVCRLDRPTRTNLGEVFPWTNWSGAGANVCAVAGRADAPGVAEPLLLGAERAAAGRVLSMPELLPDGLAVDHDGSTIDFDLIGRDFSTGPGENMVKKLRVRYELVDSTGVATVQAYYGSGNRPTTGLWGALVWGSGFWASALGGAFSLLVGINGDGPTGAGDSPWVWRVNKRRQFFRPRVRCTQSATRLIVRNVDFLVRPSGRQ